MNPRTILFIHQNFPGQFKTLARELAAEGHRVFALALNPMETIPNVTVICYLPIRTQLDEKAPSLLRENDARLIRGESIYQAMKGLKKYGVRPEVVYAHPGWGEALFVKDVWPETRLVVYAEWYYNLYGQEVNFDPAMPALSEEQQLRLRLKNTCFLHALNDCDAAITPTEWQKSRFPRWAQEKITVIHEGLNLQELAAVKPRSLSIPKQNLRLTRAIPIVTYAARYLEPVRGFHYFMRALPAILAANKEAHVIVMGRDAGVVGLGYNSMNPKGVSWRQTMQTELNEKVDWKRVHFLGMLDRKLYLAMLKLSSCHVYLTTPFILSWSFLEAAALGLPIVASDTAPVQEFSSLRGLDLVAFSDVDAIASHVLQHLHSADQNTLADNTDILAPLDVKSTIPAIQTVLLKETVAHDLGEEIEELTFDTSHSDLKKDKTQHTEGKITEYINERDAAFKEYM